MKTMKFWWFNQIHLLRLVITVPTQNGVQQQKEVLRILKNMQEMVTYIIF